MPRQSWLPCPVIWRRPLVGGATGSGLPLINSNRAFSLLVPFLPLLATIVFYRSGPVRRFASRWRRSVAPFSLGTMPPVVIYGGYFNGGPGIILPALFTMWNMTDLHRMNGLKSWLSFALPVVAFAVFAFAEKIVRGAAAMMSSGTITGGLAGPAIAKGIPLPVLRLLTAVVGSGMSAIFFYRLIKEYKDE